MTLESTASGPFAMRQPGRGSAKTHFKWSLALTTPLGHRHADGIGAKVSPQDRSEPGHQKMFRLDKIGQFVSNGQSVVPSGAVADMHLADGSQPAYHLDNTRPRPPAGAGTLHGVGLAVADAYDGLEAEHPPTNACALPMRPPFCRYFRVSTTTKLWFLPIDRCTRWATSQWSDISLAH